MFKRMKRALHLSEIVDICISENVSPSEVCKQVPSRVMEDVVFVVDSKKVDMHDMTTDDHGIYGKHSSPSQKFWVLFSEKDKVSSIQTNVHEEPEGEEYLLRRYYSWHQTKGIKRTVMKVQKQGETMQYVIIQYRVSKDIVKPTCSSDTGFGRSETYIRTKPSVLQKVKHLSHESPKVIIATLSKEAGGPIHAKSASAIPRDRRQIYNALAKVDRFKSKNTGPNKVPRFDKLLTMMAQGTFVQDVSFHVKKRGAHSQTFPNTFATTKNSIRWIRTFCSGQCPESQVNIDMTYNVGPYFLTSLTFGHPMFVYKSNRIK